jgi:hypothetical protein
VSEIAQEIMDLSKMNISSGVFKMYEFSISESELEKLTLIYGDNVPKPIVELYGISSIHKYPLGTVEFINPRELVDYIGNHDKILHTDAPALQIPPEVKKTVHYGPLKVPFAYHADSYYCLDCDPCLECGGFLYQVLNISMRTGKVKVVASDLAGFLEIELKKQKKIIQKEQKEKGKVESTDNANFDASINTAMDQRRNKSDSADATPAMGSFVEKFMGMVGNGLSALQERVEVGRGPHSIEEAGALFQFESTKEANRTYLNAYLKTLPEVSPRITDVNELKRRAQVFLAQNPQVHPVQQACARLLKLYVMYAERPDPAHEKGRLIDRINDVSEGLSEDAICCYEKGIGVTFPDDLRAFLLSHEFFPHGGERANSLGIPHDLIENCRQLNQIFNEDLGEEDHWALWPCTRVPVMGTHLIPIGWDEPMLCYDLNPGPGGEVGQLVSVDIEDSTCKVEYPSLLALLEESIREIEAMPKCS